MNLALRSILLRTALALACVVAPWAAVAASTPYQLGIYYYPGWSPGVKGPTEPDTWSSIKPYAKDREPMLGWYRDDKAVTLDRQLGWMSDAGLSFVIFDWYWENAKPATQTAVLAYLAAAQRTKVKYSLMWANHTAEPKTLGEWDALVDFWLANHFKRPEYLRIDNKPVMFVFSPDVLRSQATAMGTTTAAMLTRARARASAAGVPGIYFVLGVVASQFWVRDFAFNSGFDALSAYNYHFGIAGEDSTRTPYSKSYDELDQYYRMQWNWIVKYSKLPYFVPMTAGWDRTPWGGSSQPGHDNSVSTPATFEAHLRAGKALMDANPDKTKRIGVLCCWNEYGEGSIIEPTKKFGMQYLERIQDVFVP